MKKLILLCFNSFLLLNFNSVVLANERTVNGGSELKYYGGVNLQQRSVEFKRDFGSNLFPTKLPQLGLYFGTKIKDYFGIEIGYQGSTEETKNNTLFHGDTLFGQLLNDPADVIVLKEKIRMQGEYLDFIGFIPVTNKTQLIGSVGVSVLTVKLKHIQIGDEAGASTPEQIVKDQRNFSARKAIPRINVGCQHFFSDTYGVRGTVGYEGTGRFKNLIPKNNKSLFLASMKNSVIYSLGGFVLF